MNIIAGERRGAALFAPKGMDTRPTSAKVKESLFNMIQAYVPESRVLDLFGGSGSLSFEALSRGAACSVLCDLDREAVNCIRRNAQKLRYEDRIQVIQRDWKAAVAGMEPIPFDLVFLDPPYRMENTGEISALLARRGLLNPGAVLVLEHRTGSVPEPGEGFENFRVRTYGDTEIHIFRWNGEEEQP